MFAFNGRNCNIATDAVFARYFRPQDATFVEQIFRTIANIDLNLPMLPEAIRGILQNTPLNPAYEHLFISIGDHPVTADTECAIGIPGSRLFGYLLEQSDGSAYMSICDMCLEYPTVGEISRRRWPNGTERGPGFGCDGLLNRETEFMHSCGATVLHELIHWSALLQGIPAYNQLIPFDHALGFRSIDDFTGVDPPNGVGFFNSKRLKDLGNNPLHNADNYATFAVSSFWRWRCRRQFGPALSTTDDDARWDQLHDDSSSISSGTPKRVLHKKGIPVNDKLGTEANESDHGT